jgi:hypothetical protein
LPLAVQHNPQDADGQMGLGGLSPGVVRRLRRWGGGGRGVTASPNRLGVEDGTNRHAGGSSCEQPAPGGVAGEADMNRAPQFPTTASP